MSWFYISFAAKARGFLGATVVEADSEKSALAVATMRGLNPGGEAMVVRIPQERQELAPLVALRYRLANKAELMAAPGGAYVGRHEDASYACEDCNAGRPHTHH